MRAVPVDGEFAAAGGFRKSQTSSVTCATASTNCSAVVDRRRARGRLAHDLAIVALGLACPAVAPLGNGVGEKDAIDGEVLEAAMMMHAVALAQFLVELLLELPPA